MGMGDWKIALAVDLNDESAHAVRWVVTNYLCPGYPVMILMSDQQVFFMEQIGGHQIKYWPLTKNSNKRWKRAFDVLNAAKSTDIAKSHLEVTIPYNP